MLLIPSSTSSFKKNILSEMQPLNSYEKRFKQIAGGLGLLQGVSWVILSVICIVIYCRGKRDPVVNSYMDETRALMYILYLSDDGDGFDGQKIKPSIFAVFAWIYFFLDLIWALTSIIVLFKNEEKVASSLKFWTLVTFLVCLLDLIFVIILGVDYSICVHSVTTTSIDVRIGNEANCTNGIIPVLTIAAKGFVLWIVNVIFIFVVRKLAIKLKRDKHVQPIATYASSDQNNFVQSSQMRPQPQPPSAGYLYYHNASSPSVSPFRNNFQRLPQFHSDYYQEPFVLASPPRRPRY